MLMILKGFKKKMKTLKEKIDELNKKINDEIYRIYNIDSETIEKVESGIT